MTDVFISYAHEDKPFVRRLYRELHRRERACWVDFDGIPPSAEWRAEIYRAIDGADAFVFVISPHSVASAVCAEELAHAVAQHKRLIPILREDADSERISAEIANINWVLMREKDDFSTGCDNIIDAVDTDLDWVREHTRLLERASEWERAERDASLLLRGGELARSEEWIAKAPDMEPQPTSLHTEYVLRSRRVAVKRQRTFWSALALGLSVAVALSFTAYFQSIERERQTEIANARRLINRAEEIRERPPDEQGSGYREASTVDAVRALQGFQRAGMPSMEADRAVRESMALLPRLVQEYELPNGPKAEVSAFDPTGRYLAQTGVGAGLHVWDLVDGSRASCDWSPAGGGIRAVEIAVESTGGFVAVLTYDGTPDGDVSLLRLFNMTDCGQPAELRAAGRRYGARLGAHGQTLALGERALDVESAAPFPIADAVQARVRDLVFHPHERKAAILWKRGREVRVTVMGTDPDNPVKLAEWNAGVRSAGIMRQRPLRWSPDGGYLLLMEGSQSGVGSVRDPETGTRLHEVSADWNTVAFNRDATWMADRVSHYTIEVRAPGVGVPRMRIEDRRNDVRGVSFLPDGALVTVGNYGKIRVWDLSGSRWVAEEPVVDGVRSLEFASSSRLQAETDAGVRAWELPATVPPPTVMRPANPTDTAPGRPADGPPTISDVGVTARSPSPDGKRFAVYRGKDTRGGFRADVEIWDTTRGRLEASRPMPMDLRFSPDVLAFSPDGRYLLTETQDGVELRDATNLATIHEFFHPGVERVVFDEEGRFLATSGSDVRVWDVRSSLEMARIDEPLNQSSHLAISPGGRWLATSHGRTVRVWALHPDDLVAQACARVSRPCP